MFMIDMPGQNTANTEAKALFQAEGSALLGPTLTLLLPSSAVSVVGQPPRTPAQAAGSRLEDVFLAVTLFMKAIHVWYLLLAQRILFL